MADENPWFIDDSTANAELKNFEVVAKDGELGHIVEQKQEGNIGYFVVQVKRGRLANKLHVSKLGPGEPRLIVPGGIVERIDPGAKKVFVSQTKDEVMDMGYDMGGASHKRSTALTDTPGAGFS